MKPDTPLLDTINSPDDLKEFAPRDLPLLAEELRQVIISTVATNGGHLAPCLGVVELTMALHCVFDTPRDKMIWDVGHQAYAHKLLTGRRERFHTLRQYQGISGFPKREESPYDTFDTGHSTTSISAGLGMAVRQAPEGRPDRIIAVIGDGSMTGGMAFEGLNHAGHLDTNLIVILNDNEMSISPNVGALSNFLSRTMTGKAVTRLKQDMEGFLKSFADVGENILQVRQAQRGDPSRASSPRACSSRPSGSNTSAPSTATARDADRDPAKMSSDFARPGPDPCPDQQGQGLRPGRGATRRLSTGSAPSMWPPAAAQATPKAPPSYTEVFGETIVEAGRQGPQGGGHHRRHAGRHRP